MGWLHPNIVIVACFNIIKVKIWQVHSSSGPIEKLSYLNIHENAWKLKKNEGKSRKNYKPRRGVKVQYILHSLGLLNSC